MIISVNSLVLNDSTTGNGIYLDEPIDGLGLPPIRTSTGNNSGRPGGYVSSQFPGMRLITLTGAIFNNDVSTVEASRKALAAAVSSGSSITVNITTDGGALYTLTAYLDDLDMPIQRNKFRAPFKLSLIAPDPVIYDNSVSGSHSANIPLSLGGGLTSPWSWTPLTWAAGGMPVTVNNTGDVSLYPVITLTNKVTNPTIMNVTTGQFFFLSGFVTAPGDVLVIDMKNRTVLLNGGSVLPYVTTTSTWWLLLPGNNDIKLTSSDSSDPVTATIQWRSGVRGI
jgi:hypothetical protein